MTKLKNSKINNKMDNQDSVIKHDKTSKRKKNSHVQTVKLSSLIHINNNQVIRQNNPRLTSGNHHLYKHKRSPTYSLESYELAAKKEYIIQMLNFEYTQQYPGFHVIITFQKMMSIQSFSEKRNKALEYLAKWKVSGYYVHEPAKSHNGIHIHTLTIYNGTEEDLRECVKLAWILSGMKYEQDFHVIIKPVTQTYRDFKRLCAYILKFNGKRKTNRRIRNDSIQ